MHCTQAHMNMYAGMHMCTHFPLHIPSLLLALCPPAQPKPCPLSAPTGFLDNQHRTAIGMETT